VEKVDNYFWDKMAGLVIFVPVADHSHQFAIVIEIDRCLEKNDDQWT
jgi:hypothetical protein